MSATLEIRLTGGASNADPDLSLGGVSSSVTVSATALNNLFDDVSAAEGVAGDTEYRAIDIFNSGDATAENITMYMSSETTSTDSQVDFGIITSPIGSTESIANESTAPVGTGITFGHYTIGSRLTLPNIPAASYCRVWVKRIVSALADNKAADTGQFTIEYT